MSRYKEVADKIKKGKSLSDKEKKLHERRKKLQRSLSKEKGGKYLNEVSEGVKRGFRVAKRKKKSLKIKDD